MKTYAVCVGDDCRRFSSKHNCFGYAFRLASESSDKTVVNVLIETWRTGWNTSSLVDILNWVQDGQLSGCRQPELVDRKFLFRLLGTFDSAEGATQSVVPLPPSVLKTF
jgi:hypothetical protein